MSRNNPRDNAKAKLRRRLREERRLAAKGEGAKPAVPPKASVPAK